MSNLWREDPRLKGRFHPEHPDDLQVVVHDGGRRVTKATPEMVWVTVTGLEEEGVFTGVVINQPNQLKTVGEGMKIKFVAPGGKILLMVTDKYLQERKDWKIVPCNKCGCKDLFDAPSDLIKVLFPNIPQGSSMQKFTTFCGVCGGVLVVVASAVAAKEMLEQEAQAAKKKWWQFWK
jgi:hypothetical protein